MEIITTTEMSLRLGAALAAGLLVGLERESRGRPAGLRTTILTCLAAASAMVLSEALFISSSSGAPAGAWRPDPARLGAGILTGIGFLGAGTILRHENVVRGVTTAATLWCVTVLGLAFGAGNYLLGGFATLLALAVLTLLPGLERRLRQDWYAELTIVSQLNALDHDDVRRRAAELSVEVKSTKITSDLELQRKTIILELKLSHARRQEVCRILMSHFVSQPGVLRVSWA